MFGITHIPRLEDWPVMPVDRIGFMLMVFLSIFRCFGAFFFIDMLVAYKVIFLPYYYMVGYNYSLIFYFF